MYAVVDVGEGVAVAVGVGDADGELVGVLVVPVPAIVQVVTVDVHEVGAIKVPLSVIPAVAEAPGARDPFHEVFVAVSTPFLRLDVAFHMLTLLPAHGIETDQPLIVVEPVFVMVRSTLRPETQSEVTFTVTVRFAPV